MALFGIGKKKEGDAGPGAEGMGYGPGSFESTPAPPVGTPTDDVMSLIQQGMNQGQIVQSLKDRGFNSTQIFDAMNQASAKGAVGSPEGNMPAGPAQQPQPPAQHHAPPPPPPPSAGGFGGQREDGGERFEEIAEAIIEEKWHEFSDAFGKLREKQEGQSEDILKIQQVVTDLKGEMDNLHRAIVSKIGDYDQNLLGVGTEIKAMEQVFSKVLPTFTENINELSRVVRKIKAGK